WQFGLAETGEKVPDSGPETLHDRGHIGVLHRVQRRTGDALDVVFGNGHRTLDSGLGLDLLTIDVQHSEDALPLPNSAGTSRREPANRRGKLVYGCYARSSLCGPTAVRSSSGDLGAPDRCHFPPAA